MCLCHRQAVLTSVNPNQLFLRKLFVLFTFPETEFTKIYIVLILLFI